MDGNSLPVVLFIVLILCFIPAAIMSSITFLGIRRGGVMGKIVAGVSIVAIFVWSAIVRLLGAGSGITWVVISLPISYVLVYMALSKIYPHKKKTIMKQRV